MKYVVRIIGLMILLVGVVMLFQAKVTSLISLSIITIGLSLMAKSTSKFNPLK